MIAGQNSSSSEPPLKESLSANSLPAAVVLSLDALRVRAPDDPREHLEPTDVCDMDRRRNCFLPKLPLMLGEDKENKESRGPEAQGSSSDHRTRVRTSTAPELKGS